MKTKEEIYLIYKRCECEIKGENYNPLSYICSFNGGAISKILEFLQHKENIDFGKFFLANFLLRDKFYLTMVAKPKAFDLYEKFNGLLDDVNDMYPLIIKTMKTYRGFDFSDRDNVISIIPKVHHSLFSILYPEIKNVVESFDDEKLVQKIRNTYLVLKYTEKFNDVRNENLKYYKLK